MNRVTLICGDVLAGLAPFPDNHFDSCVTDSPYELGFMGKKWDSSGISYDVEMWRQVLRVLKPGAHLLAFGGSRTYHRLACAIEDAGFEIRDQIMWLYGSGFPKSLDVSKAMDKAAGAEREVVGVSAKTYIDNPESGSPYGGNSDNMFMPGKDSLKVTAPASPLARQWDGWGTALKPAHEPIVVARKPLEGTVVQNVLKHGTGAINVAGCRIETNPEVDDPRLGGQGTWASDKMAKNVYGGGYAGIEVGSDPNGRWPANVITDGSDEVFACFPETSSGAIKQGTPYNHSNCKTMGAAAGVVHSDFPASKGSAARFFYCAKASQAERNMGCESLPKQLCGMMEDDNYPIKTGSGNLRQTVRRNNHPTVKPIALMAYLVRLVTPPGGLVLDPFMGSGSTLIAAAKEGFDAVGIDKEATYVEMSRKRISGELGMLVEIEVKEAP